MLLTFLTFCTVLVSSSNIVIENQCTEKIWYAFTSGALWPDFNSKHGGGLKPGELSAPIQMPFNKATNKGWEGRIWGRTGCKEASDGSFIGNCDTGDCKDTSGKSLLRCGINAGEAPATLAEFALHFPNGNAGPTDNYDISLVDGFNLPLDIKVQKGCIQPKCTTRPKCPKMLRVLNKSGKEVACRSACNYYQRFTNMQKAAPYCCDSAFGFKDPKTCPFNAYSGHFKQACPMAYSFPFDDPTSFFTCKAGDIKIIFCPKGDSRVDPNVIPIIKTRAATMTDHSSSYWKFVKKYYHIK